MNNPTTLLATVAKVKCRFTKVVFTKPILYHPLLASNSKVVQTNESTKIDAIRGNCVPGDLLKS